MNTQIKSIDGKIVRRSTNWFNYGCTECGIIYRWNTEKPMTKVKTQYGYLVVRVCHNNKAKNVFTHIIVAEGWVYNDDPVNKVNVNHKDGDKTNTHSNNLEWVTRSQNQRHAINAGLKSSGEALYNAKLTSEQVHDACKMMEDGLRIKDIAVRFNVSSGVIQNIKRGDSYPNIRNLYKIDNDFKSKFSESTVRWVCERILEGFADATIAKLSTNNKMSVLEVKRIRNKIRYRSISNEYF